MSFARVIRDNIISGVDDNRLGLGRILQTSVTDFFSVIWGGGVGWGGGGGGDRIQLYQELHLHFFLITQVFNGLHGIGRACINSGKHAFQHAIKNA